MCALIYIHLVGSSFFSWQESAMYLYLKCLLFTEPPILQRQQSKPGKQCLACLTSRVMLI